MAQVLAHADDGAGRATEHPARESRTRAAVKIQDGCDNACTYCVVHIARGAQRSRPPEAVLDDVAARIAEGYREVVLTGVHIGAYGRDIAPDAPPPEMGWSLARLVGRYCSAAAPRWRCRATRPAAAVVHRAVDVTPELVACWADLRLCRHVHLPLQSGCDATLQCMGRRYTVAAFRDVVAAFRARVPEIAITTDVIVGFPGETEAAFRETCACVEALAFSRLHVFRYSPRPGTIAAAAPDPVAPAVAHARSRTLARLGRDLAQAYHRRLVGREVTVLFEAAQEGAEGRTWSGLTDTYVRVRAPATEDLGNALRRVRCTGATGLRGVGAHRGRTDGANGSRKIVGA